MWWIHFFNPLCFILGILPSITGFFIFIIDQLNYHFLGGSESGSMIKSVISFGIRCLFTFLVSLIFKADFRAAFVVLSFISFIFVNDLLYKIPFMNRKMRVWSEIKSSLKYHFKNSKLIGKMRNWIPFYFYSFVYSLISIGLVAAAVFINVIGNTLNYVGYGLAGGSLIMSIFVWIGTFFY